MTISEIAQAIQIVGEQLSIARQNVSTTESALERPNYVVSLTRFVDVFVPLPYSGMLFSARSKSERTLAN